MELTLTTPAAIFPTVSLLMLAYNHRFATLANLTRDLHARYKQDPDDGIMRQIRNLRSRLGLIRNMQVLGVLSLLQCVLCMILLFLSRMLLAECLFGSALLFLMCSLSLSVVEIHMSIGAIDTQLSDLTKTSRTDGSRL